MVNVAWSDLAATSGWGNIGLALNTSDLTLWPRWLMVSAWSR
jgi:hypothetical protein